jgi:hypothetical protein
MTYTKRERLKLERLERLYDDRYQFYNWSKRSLVEDLDLWRRRTIRTLLYQSRLKREILSLAEALEQCGHEPP